jgi:outer membrane protein assembly factor BamE (lipoprotein component of BamABCDE complex)
MCDHEGSQGGVVIRVLIRLLLLTFVGCSSAPFPEGLDGARVGMDKDAILNLGGNPARTYHEKGQDHWVYDYFKDGQRVARHIVFQNGLVVSIGPVYERKASTDKDEDDGNPEQLEKELRESQPQKPKGEFKDIP